MISQVIIHHYRRFREHGYTAEAAYWSARSHLHFMATLRKDLSDHKRRSLAAKRGWKTRGSKVK